MTAIIIADNTLLYRYRCTAVLNIFYKKRWVTYKKYIICYLLVSQLFLIFFDFREYILMQCPLKCPLNV